ncbi:hypothetical protein NL676_020844 [Syzygium grande]|nr:hypothetical protein NL676_020844 [Syzygium grande]
MSRIEESANSKRLPSFLTDYKTFNRSLNFLIEASLRGAGIMKLPSSLGSLAELTISRLTEERSLQNRERDALKRDLETLRKTGGRAIQVGFPFLYVCAVALVALAFGYIIHP